MLAAKVLMEQGLEVTGLSFKSCFFNTLKARKAAEQLGMELVEVDFSEEHLKMVKKPDHGYGQNMNPCSDCHGMMLRHAKEYLKKDSKDSTGSSRRRSAPPQGDGFDIIATGEVLGQRPMSQNKEALKIVEKISGLENKILRPLSAKLLSETEVENTGKVDREKLLDIKGRSRSAQTELAARFGIKDYPSPAGGCLLTDPEFGEKLKKLFENRSACGRNDIEIIKHGRNFWIGEALLIVARNARECGSLEQLAKAGDYLIELKEETGPLSLLRTSGTQAETEAEQELDIPESLGEIGREDLFGWAGLLTGFYATKARGKKVKIIFRKI